MRQELLQSLQTDVRLDVNNVEGLEENLLICRAGVLPRQGIFNLFLFMGHSTRKDIGGGLIISQI